MSKLLLYCSQYCYAQELGEGGDQEGKVLLDGGELHIVGAQPNSLQTTKANQLLDRAVTKSLSINLHKVAHQEAP